MSKRCEFDVVFRVHPSTTRVAARERGVSYSAHDRETRKARDRGARLRLWSQAVPGWQGISIHNHFHRSSKAWNDEKETRCHTSMIPNNRQLSIDHEKLVISL